MRFEWYNFTYIILIYLFTWILLRKCKPNMSCFGNIWFGRSEPPIRKYYWDHLNSDTKALSTKELIFNWRIHEAIYFIARISQHKKKNHVHAWFTCMEIVAIAPRGNTIPKLRMEYLGELLSNNISVCLFDFSGSGNSEG